jgi:hypothetical protein
MTEAAELAVEARCEALLDAYGHFLREAIPRLAPGPLVEHLGELVQEARIRLARALEAQRVVADPAAYAARLAATSTVEAVRRVKSRWPAPTPHDRAACPAPDALALAEHAQLDPGAKAELTAHVAGCPECTQELSLVAAVGVWSQGVASIVAAAAAAAPAISRASRPARRVPLAALLALAVVCGVLAIYAAIQRSSSRRLLAEFQAVTRRTPTSSGEAAARAAGAPGPLPASPSAPMAGVAMVELRPQPAARPSSRTDLDLASPVVLLLQAPGAAPSEPRLRLRATDGNIAWEGAVARRPPGPAVTLLLPAGAVQPGEYRIDLLDGGGRPAHHYFVRVVSSTR